MKLTVINCQNKGMSCIKFYERLNVGSTEFLFLHLLKFWSIRFKAEYFLDDSM